MIRARVSNDELERSEYDRAVEHFNRTVEPSWKRHGPDGGYKLCPSCAGRGFCNFCDGSGKRGETERCFSCRGNGRCRVCEGDGQLTEEMIEMMDGPPPTKDD